MESLIPIFRMLHFVGFSLLLGGFLCSLILVKNEKPSLGLTKTIWYCTHLVAAPGLFFLIMTGIFQSSIMQWENFKNAGYMHLKITLALAIVLFMVFDIKTQKKILKTNPEPSTLKVLLTKRQGYAIGACLSVLVIMWLVNFRPF